MNKMGKGEGNHHFHAVPFPLRSPMLLCTSEYLSSCGGASSSGRSRRSTFGPAVSGAGVHTPSMLGRLCLGRCPLGCLMLQQLDGQPKCLGILAAEQLRIHLRRHEGAAEDRREECSLGIVHRRVHACPTCCQRLPRCRPLPHLLLLATGCSCLRFGRARPRHARGPAGAQIPLPE